MAKKGKTLPSDFAEILKSGDLEAIKAVFEKCDINAYERGSLQTPALCFYEMSPKIATWLVQNGANIDATDSYGKSGLFYHAQVGNESMVLTLLELGANAKLVTKYSGGALHFAKTAKICEILLKNGATIDTKNDMRKNALEYHLQTCNNIDIEDVAKIAEILLAAGFENSKFCKEQVTQIGERFEFSRDRLDIEFVAGIEPALQKLYKLFDVKPAPKRLKHDGVSPINLPHKSWQENFEYLWKLLVPTSGASKILQGEIVRVCGRLNDEIMRNGGGNWDSEYKKMANALTAYFASANTLDQKQFEMTKKIVAKFPDEVSDDEISLLLEFAVIFVEQNPNPIKLDAVKYKR